jgi:phage tail-like protein
MRSDPVLAYNFRVNLLESTSSPAAAVGSLVLSPLVANPLAGFNECTGLEMTLETEDHAEGGNNGTLLRFPKRAKWSDITLRKGMTRRTELFDWYYAFTQGVTWKFRRGRPVKYVAPQLNAQQSAVAIETLTIAHEGISLMAGASGLASAVRGAASAIGDLF